jgi:hypothetical protein
MEEKGIPQPTATGLECREITQWVPCGVGGRKGPEYKNKISDV